MIHRISCWTTIFKSATCIDCHFESSQSSEHTPTHYLQKTYMHRGHVRPWSPRKSPSVDITQCSFAEFPTTNTQVRLETQSCWSLLVVLLVFLRICVSTSLQKNCWPETLSNVALYILCFLNCFVVPKLWTVQWKKKMDFSYCKCGVSFRHFSWYVDWWKYGILKQKLTHDSKCLLNWLA